MRAAGIDDIELALVAGKAMPLGLTMSVTTAVTAPGSRIDAIDIGPADLETAWLPS